MPVDPSTVAGAMYYVFDSATMMDHVEGRISTLPLKERDARFSDPNLSFRFGEIKGELTGMRRVGVEALSKADQPV
jgi:hypothetical protein